MRFCIHRGTQEIGGTCIELEAQGKRLVLDVGLPLDKEDDAALLPDVAGFREPDESLLGIAISHAHPDHYGLARHVRADVPVLIGEAAHRILNAAGQFMPGMPEFSNVTYLRDREPVALGPFRITPYLVDHSAYDSQAFLIEADGKRIFYSGDFRGHGRTAHRFEELIKRPPTPIDLLFMEGTTLSREVAKEGFTIEADLEPQFAEVMLNTSGMVMAFASAQNIDRMVTLYHAAQSTGRELLIDLYTAEILRATADPTIPQAYWEGVRVWVPGFQRGQVWHGKKFDLLGRYKSCRVYTEALTADPGRYLLLFRPPMGKELEAAGCLRNGQLIYSLWDGYLEEDRLQPFVEWRDRLQIPMVHIHTSGHAPIPDLKRFSKALAPKMLVPIHTEHGNDFVKYFDNAAPHRDGEWRDVL